MRTVSRDDFSFIKDKNSNPALGPTAFLEVSNSDEYAFLKSAILCAEQHFLSDAEVYMLHSYYWEGKQKIQIAKEMNVVSSTITKKMKKAENKLKIQLEFALSLYKNLKNINNSDYF